MRRFGAQNVRLPRLSTDAAIALGSALTVAYEAADTRGLPLQAIHAADGLRRANEALLHELSEKIGSKSAALAGKRRRAHLDLAACWSAIESALAHLVRMPADPELEEPKARAREVHRLLFGGGLRFLLRRFREAWAESSARLQIIDEQGFAPTIEAVGGGLLLGPLRRTHARYGELLGITEPSADKPRPDIKRKLAAFADALREYVAKIGAVPSPSVPGSTELAAMLLHPLVTWVSPRAHANKQAVGAAETAANERPPETHAAQAGDAPDGEGSEVGPPSEARAGP
jgi:hypothetical protein